VVAGVLLTYPYADPGKTWPSPALEGHGSECFKCQAAGFSDAEIWHQWGCPDRAKRPRRRVQPADRILRGSSMKTPKLFLTPEEDIVYGFRRSFTHPNKIAPTGIAREWSLQGMPTLEDDRSSHYVVTKTGHVRRDAVGSSRLSLELWQTWTIDQLQTFPTQLKLERCRICGAHGPAKRVLHNEQIHEGVLNVKPELRGRDMNYMERLT
jgi:hypothetical protein